MKKQSPSTSSPTTSESSTYSIHDPPGYIKPSLQDIVLTDITAAELLVVAERLGVDYLGPAKTFPVSFPVEGEIYGPNKRLMVDLACFRRRTNTSAINVIFLSILALQLRTYWPRPWKYCLEILEVINSAVISRSKILYVTYYLMTSILQM